MIATPVRALHTPWPTQQVLTSDVARYSRAFGATNKFITRKARAGQAPKGSWQANDIAGHMQVSHLGRAAGGFVATCKA
eukprot:scaffold1025_cov381-Prasinococcus_capsulatus_cf.AAC.5